MKRILIVSLLLGLAGISALLSQGPGVYPPPVRHHGWPGVTRASGGIPFANLEALYAPPSNVLNPSAKWYTPATNLLLQSENLTGWSVSGTPVVTATTAEDDNAGSYELIYGNAITPVNGITYTAITYVAKDAVSTRFPLFRVSQSGNVLDCKFRTDTGAADGCTSVTDLGDRWLVLRQITATSTSSLRVDLYPAVGVTLPTNNAAGVGEITVYKTALFVGALDAAQAAAIYEKTTDRQVITDFSGSGNNATRGANATAATDDPSLAVTSRNQIIAGTSADLTPASWVATNATKAATTFTPSAADGQVVQSFTGVSGAVYRVSATIASAGNTDLEWTLDGVETAVAVTASPVRYSVVYTGDGAAANIGLRDPAAGGYGAITFTDIQVERVPSASSTATAYVDPAEPTITGWDLVTDDIITGSGIALPSDWTQSFLMNPDDNTTVGLAQNGTGAQKISLDSDGVPVYTNGTDTVRASYPNLLVSFEDMTGTGWLTVGTATVNSATTFTTAASGDYVYQNVTTVASTNYTLFFTMRVVSGNTSLKYAHVFAELPAGNTTGFTFTGTLTDYAFPVTGKVGGGAVRFGLGDFNASGFGQIEVTRWAVFQGTYNAAEAAALYEAFSTFKIPQNLWSLVTAKNVGNTITFYLNGTALGSGSATGATNAWTAARFGYNAANYYDGRFGLIGVWTRGLTADKVEDLYEELGDRLDDNGICLPDGDSWFGACQ